MLIARESRMSVGIKPHNAGCVMDKYEVAKMTHKLNERGKNAQSRYHL
jgi:hypothetical protein